MFKKTGLKIKWSFIAFLTLFIVFECSLSVYSINQIMYRNMLNYSQKAIALNMENCTALIELASKATDLVASDPQIIEKVRQRQYFLNSLKLQSLSIIGVTLYDTSGNYYHSDGMAGVLPLSKMAEEARIASFFEDETEDAFFSVRATSINSIYTNNQLYDARQGIITYIRKVYDSERKVIGYLFLDISPKYLYSNFFSYTDDLGEAVSFIVFDSDNYLQTVANEPYAGYLKYLATGQPVRTKDLRYIVATQSFMDFDAELVTLIPLKPFYRKQALLTFPIILISLVFIVLSCIIGNRESKKVVDSLTALNTKMKEAYKEFEKS